MSLGTGIGLGSLFGGLFGASGVGKGPNPADKANQYLQQIPEQTKPYYDPYINAGNESLTKLMQMLGMNPTDTYNQLGSGYKESPGYKFQLEQALKAGSNASAAGGMLGTPYHQQTAQDTAQGLAARDFDEYMKNVLGLHSQQEAGYGNVANLGANAANQYASGLAENLGKQGQYAYEGQKGQNEANQQNWSNIFGSIPWFFA